MKLQASHVFPVLPLLALVLAPRVTHANAPAGRYNTTVDSTGTTLIDTKTGLTWQRGANSTLYTWGSASTAGTAQAYCASLKLFNEVNWRVPTAGELLSLVDYSQSVGTNYMIDLAFQMPAVTEQGYYWASTPVPPTGGLTTSNLSWYVNFYNGLSGQYDQGNTAFVRCVHT